MKEDDQEFTVFIAVIMVIGFIGITGTFYLIEDQRHKNRLELFERGISFCMDKEDKIHYQDY